MQRQSSATRGRGREERQKTGTGDSGREQWQRQRHSSATANSARDQRQNQRQQTASHPRCLGRHRGRVCSFLVADLPVCPSNMATRLRGFLNPLTRGPSIDSSKDAARPWRNDRLRRSLLIVIPSEDAKRPTRNLWGGQQGSSSAPRVRLARDDAFWHSISVSPKDTAEAYVTVRRAPRGEKTAMGAVHRALQPETGE